MARKNSLLIINRCGYVGGKLEPDKIEPLLFHATPPKVLRTSKGPDISKVTEIIINKLRAFIPYPNFSGSGMVVTHVSAEGWFQYKRFYMGSSSYELGLWEQSESENSIKIKINNKEI